MDRLSIVVCDDDPIRVVDWADSIREVPGVADRYDVTPLTPEQFVEAFEALQTRKADEAQDRTASRDDKAAAIDKAAILILDYDLTPRHNTAEPSLGEVHGPLKQLEGKYGDTFALLARCYSTTGYIVLVNHRVQTSTFDLTMTMFMNSISDLNVAQPDLERPELWLGSSANNAGPAALPFRPSHWPALLDAPSRLVDFASAVELDQPILPFLGIASDMVTAFADEQLDVFSLRDDDDTDPSTVTFRQLATESAYGLSGKSDKQSDENILRRIAAAGVLRWLERVVVPAQNVLIDAAHLAERFPQLIPTGANDAETWSALTSVAAGSGVIEQLPAAAEHLLPKLSVWLSRPVWSAAGASRVARSLPRLASAETPRVFCEDVSSFAGIDVAQEYTSALPGSFRQRFVAQVRSADVDYRPRRRLLA